MRYWIYGIVAFLIFWILLDELAYTWWQRIHPGLLYSLVTQPQPTVGYGSDRNLNTLKTDINRFYPTR